MKLRTKDKIETALKVLAIAVVGSCWINLVVTFLVAYNNPGKTTVVFIDRFGEANAELCFLMVSLVIVPYLILRYFGFWEQKKHSIHGKKKKNGSSVRRV